MYTPTAFQSQDFNEAFTLMQSHPFATLLSAQNSEISISHLPLTPVQTNTGFILQGHMARANSHWKSLDNQNVTAIFHGPHTYITPKWYTQNDVPTWNYIVLHVQGKLKVVTDSEKTLDSLKTLVTHAESQWPSGWQFFLPEDLNTKDAIAKSLVAFEITVTNWLYKKKLNQNRSQADQNGVIAGLNSRTDDNSQAIQKAMQMNFKKYPTC